MHNYSNSDLFIFAIGKPDCKTGVHGYLDFESEVKASTDPATPQRWLLNIAINPNAKNLHDAMNELASFMFRQGKIPFRVYVKNLKNTADWSTFPWDGTRLMREGDEAYYPEDNRGTEISILLPEAFSASAFKQFILELWAFIVEKKFETGYYLPAHCQQLRTEGFLTPFTYQAIKKHVLVKEQDADIDAEAGDAQPEKGNLNRNAAKAIKVSAEVFDPYAEVTFTKRDFVGPPNKRKQLLTNLGVLTSITRLKKTYLASHALLLPKEDNVSCREAIKAERFQAEVLDLLAKAEGSPLACALTYTETAEEVNGHIQHYFSPHPGLVDYAAHYLSVNEESFLSGYMRNLQLRQIADTGKKYKDDDSNVVDARAILFQYFANICSMNDAALLRAAPTVTAFIASNLDKPNVELNPEEVFMVAMRGIVLKEISALVEKSTNYKCKLAEAFLTELLNRYSYYTGASSTKGEALAGLGNEPESVTTYKFIPPVDTFFNEIFDDNAKQLATYKSQLKARTKAGQPYADLKRPMDYSELKGLFGRYENHLNDVYKALKSPYADYSNMREADVQLAP